MLVYVKKYVELINRGGSESAATGSALREGASSDHLPPAPHKSGPRSFELTRLTTNLRQYVLNI